MLSETSESEVGERRPPLTRAIVAELQARAEFVPAVRAMAQSWIDLFQGNRVLNLMTSDRGRLQLGLLVMYLHITRDPNDPTSGLTPGRLKAKCAEQHVCSAGRAGTMLRLMQMSGHVAAVPTADRRLRLLAPTELLIAPYRTRWKAIFQSVNRVAPVEGLLEACDKPEFTAAHVRVLTEYFQSGYRLLQDVPLLLPFAEANAGFLTLYSLFLAGDANDKSTDARTVRISISELSRRFGVSRAHIKQILRDAEASQLLEVRGPGEIFLSTQLMKAVHEILAIMLAYERHCCERALAEMAAT